MEHWTRNRRRSFLWTTKSPATWQEAFSLPYETDLRSWRNHVDLQIEADIEIVVSFVCSESIGFGHNHARALLCRKLKHVEISKTKVARLARVIGNRLISGDFSEQFFDQLRLVAQKDISTLQHYCRCALSESRKQYVIDFARRALDIPSHPIAGRVATRFPIKRRARWVPHGARAQKEAADRAGIAYWKARCGCANSKAMVWLTDISKRLWNSRGELYPSELVEKANHQESHYEEVLYNACKSLAKARVALHARLSII